MGGDLPFRVSVLEPLQAQLVLKASVIRQQQHDGKVQLFPFLTPSASGRALAVFRLWFLLLHSATETELKSLAWHLQY